MIRIFGIGNGTIQTNIIASQSEKHSFALVAYTPLLVWHIVMCTNRQDYRTMTVDIVLHLFPFPSSSLAEYPALRFR